MKKETLIFLFFIPLLIFIVFTINVQSTTNGLINNGDIITGRVITGEATETSIAVSIAVLALPILTIIKPENETYLTTNNLLLNYSSRGEDSIWYNLDSGSNTTITSSTTFNTTSGGHTLYLYANNSQGEVVKNITFTINSSKFQIRYSEWTGENKGSSTNFNISSYEDIQNLSGIIIENSDHGKIIFLENINLTDDLNNTDNQVDLAAHINISFNRIEINTTALPNFNKSATLKLYGLSFSDPRILRDGAICPSSICTNSSYSSNTLTFTVNQFSVYTSEETPEDVEEEVPPPIVVSGGGGGTTISKAFSLSTDEISAKLNQGRTIQKLFTITNTGTQKLIFTIENPTLKDFLKISEISFELGPGKSKTIILDIIAKEDSFPNLYVGKLIIKASRLEKELLVVVEIESPEALFDVEIEIPRRYLEVFPGDEILGEITLYNLGELGKVDAVVEYIIKDENNKVVTTASDTIAVETRTSFIKSILIPKNVKYGRHLFYIRVTYDSKVASASVFFEVVETGISEKEKLYIISIIFLIVLLSIVIYYFIRHHRRSHGKIIKKIDIKDLLKI